MRLFLTTILLITLSLSACVTPSDKTAISTLKRSNLKQSLRVKPPNIIISRIGSAPLALASRVKADGLEIVRLMNGQYMEFYLEPGDHTIAVSYNPLSLQKGDKINLKVRSGATYFNDIGSNINIYLRTRNTTSVDVRLNAKNGKETIIELERCCRKINIQRR